MPLKRWKFLLKEGWQDRDRTCVIFKPAVVEVTNG